MNSVVSEHFKAQPRKLTRTDALAAIKMKINDRVFIGIFSCGISYSDRAVEEHGDYKKLAFLSYSTLELKCYTKHAGMRKYIEEHAETVIARKGEQFSVSACGQTVLLGGG